MNIDRRGSAHISLQLFWTMHFLSNTAPYNRTHVSNRCEVVILKWSHLGTGEPPTQSNIGATFCALAPFTVYIRHS